MAVAIISDDGAHARAVRRKIFNLQRHTWRKDVLFHETPRYLTAAATRILFKIDWLEACSRRDQRDLRARPIVQPSQRELAAMCDLGRETVCRAVVHVLEALGLVKVSRRIWSDGRFCTHCYELTKKCRSLLGIAVRAAPPRPDPSRVMYRSHGIGDKYDLDPRAAYALGKSPPETS